MTDLQAQELAMQNILTTHFNNLALGQQQDPVNMIQQQQPSWCEVCGSGEHSTDILGLI